jgi:hypothetical protein
MNIKNLKITLIIACLLQGSLFAQSASKPKLTSRVLKWLDNKPLGMDVKTLGDVLHVRRGIRKILFGILDPVTKKFIGFYVFDSEKRTLRWLADYERALTKEFMEQKAALEKQFVTRAAFEAEWNQVKKILEQEFESMVIEHLDQVKRSVFDPDECEYQLMKVQRELTIEHENVMTAQEEEVMVKHIKNRNEYFRQLKLITDAYQKKMMALIPCLKMAIADFVTANEPFAITMQGTKGMMLILVEEFCLKYKRPYSFLLEWANVEEGQEIVAFQKKMTSCRALDEFCTDLTDFLEALYYSCEKARAEYEAQEKAKKK